MSLQCPQCGASLEDDSLFCRFCGTRVSLGSSSTLEQHLGTVTVDVPKKSRLWIVIAVGLIVVLVVGGVFGFFWWGSWKNSYLGEKTFYVESKLFLDISLDIYNSEGDVSVQFVDSSNLLNATIKVYGNEGAELDKAQTFSTTIEGDQLIFKFDSSKDESTPFFGLFDRSRFTYDLFVWIAKEARSSMDIRVSSGSISLMVQNSTTFAAMDIDVRSGSIEVDLGTNTTINCTKIYSGTSSGSIDLKWEDLITESDIYWELEAPSGSIDIEAVQSYVPENSTKLEFVIEVDSGSVSIDYDFGPTVGLKLEGDVSSGYINFPGGEEFYLSPNYDIALLQLDFYITVISGDINANPM